MVEELKELKWIKNENLTAYEPHEIVCKHSLEAARGKNELKSYFGCG